VAGERETRKGGSGMEGMAGKKKRNLSVRYGRAGSAPPDCGVQRVMG